MGTRWSLQEPLLVDRAAVRRETYDLAQCVAVLVRHGALATRDGMLARIPAHQVPDPALVVYLGQEAGRDVVALVLADAADAEVSAAHGLAWTGLREHLAACAGRGVEGALDRELGATAVALATWHENHPRCALCGAPTVPRKGGWVRWCETDQREHYPRTDPAVIVAITDAQDRLLIAHASYWSPRRFSHLAGYVEPGEALEQAVHREVGEEAGLTVRDITYVASQPWPFPASVMVGFTARVDDPTLTLDQDEITEAIFVTREELAAMHADGSVLLPPPGSIARRLMEDWYGGDIR